jgi:hypothetical protein
MNNMQFQDETRYSMFLSELISDSVAMCSAVMDQSDVKVIQARGDKFLIDTAKKRSVKQ